MAPEKFIPTSLEHIVEFVKNTKNDIWQMWIYDNEGKYLGSLLPTLKKLDVSITEQQLTMVLYKSDDNNVLQQNALIINNSNDYGFYYL